MIELKLTPQDYQSLCILMGYANAAHTIKDGPLPQAWKDLTDWILIQGDESNYTYYNDKNRLKEQKLKELTDLKERE